METPPVPYSSGNVSDSSGSDSQNDNDLDLTNSGRGVWLVKVPKYISKQWEKAPENAVVGKLKISREPGQKSQVQLSHSESLRAQKEPEEQYIPKVHNLEMSTVTNQCLGVFSHVAPTTADTGSPEPEKLFMEGWIERKLDCKTYADNKYFKYKSDAIRKACMPQRQVLQLDRVVNNFKPVSNHAHNILYQKQKKEEGKRTRDDKESVLKLLYTAFDKQQYYYIKDLQKITKQPKVYLQEILKEICNFNIKNPHRNMWELKPQYVQSVQKNTTVEAKEDESSSDSD